MAEQVVHRETLSITQTNITHADKVLGAQFNRVAWKALQIAERTLDFGPETARQSLVRMFIPAISKLSTLDKTEELTEHRASFLRTLSAMAEITESLDVITPADMIEEDGSYSIAALERTLNQDDQP